LEVVLAQVDGRLLKLQDLEDAVVDKAAVHQRAE
jgi:hypothetical protein